MTDYGRWTYGEAGDEYPVQPGDVWRVGHHVLGCADLETGQVAKFVGEYGRHPEIAYVDPPWNQGNARSFRTKAAVSRAVDFDLFLASLVDAVSQVDHIYVEMGHQNHAALAETVQAYGGTVIGFWDIFYYRTKPCVLLGCDFSDGKRPWPDGDYNGLDDEDTPDEILSRYASGLTVFDPCMGRGLTALAAHAHGQRFIGTELHPRRMAVTIKKMVDTHSITAEKIGEL